MPERIEFINKSKETFARALNETDKFDIVYGVTMKNAGGEPTFIKSEASGNTYALCDDKLELSRSETIKGQSNGFDISVLSLFIVVLTGGPQGFRRAGCAANCRLANAVRQGWGWRYWMRWWCRRGRCGK
jgi:hypothetical protein